MPRSIGLARLQGLSIVVDSGRYYVEITGLDLILYKLEVYGVNVPETAGNIRAADIEQLDAIYIRHTPHKVNNP